MRHILIITGALAVMVAMTVQPVQGLDLDKYLHSIQLTAGYTQGYDKQDAYVDRGYGAHTGVIVKFPLGSPNFRLGLEFQYNYNYMESTDDHKVQTDWGVAEDVRRNSGFINEETGELYPGWGGQTYGLIDRFNGEIWNEERFIIRPIILSLEAGFPIGKLEPYVGAGFGLYTFKGTLSRHETWQPTWENEGFPSYVRHDVTDKAFHLFDKNGQAWSGVVRGGVNYKINNWLGFTARIDYHMLGKEENFHDDQDEIWYNQIRWPDIVAAYKAYREKNPTLDIIRLKNWLHLSAGFSFYY